MSSKSGCTCCFGQFFGLYGLDNYWDARDLAVMIDGLLVEQRGAVAVYAKLVEVFPELSGRRFIVLDFGSVMLSDVLDFVPGEAA